jgi:hypothetical protein
MLWSENECGKSCGNDNLKATVYNTNYDGSKQPGNMKYFKYLGNARCRRDIIFRIAMANAAFNKKKHSFSGQLDLNLREKLEKCYVWNRNSYSAEKWTVWKLYHMYHIMREMWSWRRTEEIIGIGHVKMMAYCI